MLIDEFQRWISLGRTWPDVSFEKPLSNRATVTFAMSASAHNVSDNIYQFKNDQHKVTVHSLIRSTNSKIYLDFSHLKKQNLHTNSNHLRKD